jgi:hypothetical protein
MKRRLIQLALLLVIGVSPGLAEKQQTIVFEATVVRLEPWPPMKISCGVAIVYRLAEYKIDTVYKGHILSGEQLYVEHLACNYNELDEIKAGDKVIVIAVPLSKPEKHFWVKYPVEQGAKDSIIVSYRGLKVAKIIYPSSNSASGQ